MKWLWSLSDRLLGGTGRLLLFFCSYPETGHAEMAAASARAGRKTLMVRFGGVKGGGREQFGGHRIAAFPEHFHEGKGYGFLPLIFVENR